VSGVLTAGMPELSLVGQQQLMWHTLRQSYVSPDYDVGRHWTVEEARLICNPALRNGYL